MIKFLVHLSQRLKCTIVITRCWSSVIHPSLTYHIFNFSSETTKQNSTKLDRKQELNILYQVCVFRVDQKNKMAALALIGWDIFNLSSETTERTIKETWLKARSQYSLQSLFFLGRSEKQDGRPGLWLAEIISTSPLKSLKRIKRNLTGSKILMSSTKFVFFGLIGKTRWPPWPLIGWDIFDFSETVECEFNETWQEARSQCPLPSLCWSEKQDGHPGF